MDDWSEVHYRLPGARSGINKSSAILPVKEDDHHLHHHQQQQQQQQHKTNLTKTEPYIHNNKSNESKKEKRIRMASGDHDRDRPCLDVGGDLEPHIIYTQSNNNY